jgi:GDP-D-mannose dehydratase
LLADYQFFTPLLNCRVQREVSKKGYRVYGLLRRASSEQLPRIEHIRERLTLLHGDLLDQSSLVRVLEQTQPDEVYNLAAMSFVPASFEQPVLTAEVNAVGVVRLLDSERQICPNLQADASKARRCLRWQAQVGFEQLVRLMVDADLALLGRHDTVGAAVV